jgi:hypothetical protein
MKCTPISDTHIQNNTCVLAPEATEGPYYHHEDHPSRWTAVGMVIRAFGVSLHQN